MTLTVVQGKNARHDVQLFTLSTCGWCKKIKNLLRTLDVTYAYTDVDLCIGDELIAVTDELKKFNPHFSYPTIVIDSGKKVIIGFKDADIKAALR